MFKKFFSFYLIISLLIINNKSIQANDFVDNVCSVAKGIVTGVVSISACEGIFETIINGTGTHLYIDGARFNDPSKTSRLRNGLDAVSYAYAISKLAPYSRRALTLQPATLFDEAHSPVTKNRLYALGRTLINGIVGANSAYSICENVIFMNKKDQNAFNNIGKITEITLGKILALGFTCYKAFPDAYRHARVAFHF